MNILITCVGRRNYLVEYFRQALGGRGLVCAVDVNEEAPALQVADISLVVPGVSDPGYFDHLLDICRRHAIRLLVSLNDLELPGLARQRERFLHAGTLPVISSPEVVDLCFDKWRTQEFLRQHGLIVPRTYLSLAEARAALEREDIEFPLVVKPRWGSASIGITYPEDLEELELTYRLVSKRLPHTILGLASATDPERGVMIQERLRGQEYGLDVVNDLEGRYVATFVKRKLVMRAGETDRAGTEAHAGLLHVGEILGRAVRHRGNLDCDVFVKGNDCYILEMNPRFGGGYPFSHVAGVNLPAALIAWANREEPDPSWFRARPGVLASKCDHLIIIDPALRTYYAGAQAAFDEALGDEGASVSASSVCV